MPSVDQILIDYLEKIVTTRQQSFTARSQKFSGNVNGNCFRERKGYEAMIACVLVQV